MSHAGTNILRRKVAAAAVRHAKASLQSSLVQDIEKATSKIFLDALEAEVTATVSERTISSHTATIEAMSAILFGIVEFGDEIGLCGFDARFIDTAISNLTGGTNRATADRRATKTDAAICNLVINKILTEVFAHHDADGADVGMRDYEHEKAPLVFLLSELDYALLRVNITDAEGTDIGKFELAIPLACIEKISAIEASNATSLEHDIWRLAMTQIAVDAPIELDSVVQRMNIALGRLLSLKQGDLLELPDGSLTALSLEGQTASGPQRIFTGQLGSLKVQKAFKVTRFANEEHAPH